VVPPVGAGLRMVTEQFVELPLGKADTAHTRELIVAWPVRDKLAVCELLLYVAVMIAV